MDRSEIMASVSELAVEILAVEPALVIEEAQITADLDADSLDLVELIKAVEERFDITVPETDLEDVTTIGLVVDLVSDRLSART
jgi:acyl carrier protein